MILAGFHFHSYTHDQLKYLAWQVTAALQYVHDMGFVHGSVSPTTIRCVPHKRQVCLAGFSVHDMYDEVAVTDYPTYAAYKELYKGLADPVWDLHELAYSVIVLAGGTLPWANMQRKQEIIQAHLECGEPNPADFVAQYASYLDATLLEWLKQALSLKGAHCIEYDDFLDYLWR